jgi:predicted transcriptional regulator
MEYQYKGVGITAKVAQDIIMDFLSSGNRDPRKRADIASHAVKTHIQRGGVASNSDSRTQIKKALQTLHSMGHVEKATVGFWRVSASYILSIESECGPKIVSELESKVLVVEKLENVTPVYDFSVERELGEGKGYVYLYFFPNYKLTASMKEEAFWPCKIGYSDAQGLERISSQLGTSHAEKPVIGLKVNSDNAIILEKIIHRILGLRKRKIPDSPGQEWFLTNPDEVEKIVKFSLDSFFE